MTVNPRMMDVQATLLGAWRRGLGVCLCVCIYVHCSMHTHTHSYIYNLCRGNPFVQKGLVLNILHHPKHLVVMEV